MKPLSYESRALLEAVRGREGLSSADRERIRGKLTARIGAGLALGSAVTASATVAEAAHVSGLATVAAWLPAAAKVVSVVAIASGVTVGAVHVSQRASQPAARAASPMRADPRGRTPAMVSPLVSPVATDVPVSGQTEHGLVQVEAAVAKAPSAAKRDSSTAIAPTSVEGATPVEPPTPTDDGLPGQISAIRNARVALRRGDGTAALTALNRAFVSGQSGPLGQEAAVVRVTALCLLGDTAGARRLAEQFLTNYPASPLCAKIRSTCAFP